MFKKDWMGLEKLDKELSKTFKNMDKAFDIGENAVDIGKPSRGKSKRSRNFPTPKPHYTQKKNKPIMTKKDQETAKKIIKETGSAFGSVYDKIKNRKIYKLEKEAMKAQKKSQALAHKVKTTIALSDYLLDIEKYQKELDIEETKLRERKAQQKDPQNKKVDHSQACLDYNMAFESDTRGECICNE